MTLQPELLTSLSNSELTITSAIFQDVTSTISHISLLESHCQISNITVTNFTLPGTIYEAFLEIDLESTALVRDVNFTDSKGGFVFVLESEMEIDNVFIENVQADYYVLNIDQGYIFCHI